MNAGPPPLPPPPEVILVAAPGPLRIKVRPADLSNYSRTRREPKGIVLHCTDGCEGTTQAEDAAAELAQPHLAKSFHYAVDADSVTRCVPDMLTAYHARHTGNAWGIGVEICGRAAQTRAQWLDPVSRATLQLAARLCADLCREYRIQPVIVDAAGLVTGQRGITTHAAVAKAWRESDHWDPGPGFPLVAFVAAVAAALAASRVV